MIIFLSASFGRRFLKHYVFLFFGCQKHSPSMAFGKHNSLDGSCWWRPVFQHINKASSPLWSQKLRIAALNQKHWKSTQDTGIAYLRGALKRDAFLMNFTRQRVIFKWNEGFFFHKDIEEPRLSMYFQAGEGMFWMKCVTLKRGPFRPVDRLLLWFQGRGHHLWSSLHLSWMGASRMIGNGKTKQTDRIQQANLVKAKELVGSAKIWCCGAPPLGLSHMRLAMIETELPHGLWQNCIPNEARKWGSTAVADNW